MSSEIQAVTVGLGVVWAWPEALMIHDNCFVM